MKKVLGKQHSCLVRTFHTLCTRLGMDEEVKRSIVRSCGVESSKDMTIAQLVDVCDKLEKELNPQLAEMDVWRKRVMASIGAWLKTFGRESNGQIIKAIAVRASKKKRFNDIPMEQLRSLYNAFNKKADDMKMVEGLTIEELNSITLMN